MAEQSPAANAQVYETPQAWLGKDGLQLNKPLDDLTMQEVSRIANLWQSGGGLQTRLGQTQVAALSGTVHSIRRLNSPQTGTYTRLWGAGTSWYRGQSGAPTALDAGLSGNPLTLIPVRPPFSGQPWMVMADSNAMRKATLAGTSLPLGLPIPTAPTLTVNAGKRKDICKFEAADGSQAASWTKYGAITGVPDIATQEGDPTLSDITGTVNSAVNLLSYSSAPAPGGTWPDPPGPGADGSSGAG